MNSAIDDEKKSNQAVGKWLNEKLWLELVDGRIIVGKLTATDQHPNLIMVQCREFWENEFREMNRNINDNSMKMRNVGMLLVKGEHIKRIYLVK